MVLPSPSHLDKRMKAIVKTSYRAVVWGNAPEAESRLDTFIREVAECCSFGGIKNQYKSVLQAHGQREQKLSARLLAIHKL